MARSQPGGSAFLNRVHALDLAYADRFFGGTLVVAGLIGTLIGGYAATAWHRKTRVGYAYLLTLSVLATVIAATAAFWSSNAEVSMASLGAAMFFAFLPTGPINTLLLESVPIFCARAPWPPRSSSSTSSAISGAR